MTTPKTGGSNCMSETPRICIVGAGFGGTLAAIQLKRRLGLTSFTILDKNHDFGGVWLTTKYPGLSSDIVGYIFCYLFEVNLGSSQLFPDRLEIWQYIRRMALKYSLYEHTRFGTTVSSMTWTGRKWIVTSSLVAVEEPKDNVEEYDLVIMATGPYHEANYPEKFRSFTGPIMHSANWDSSILLENKVVGVVGSSSSALQIIPAVVPIAKEVVCYQRSAPYCLSKSQMQIPKWVNFLIRWVPGLLWIVLAFSLLVTEVTALGLTSSRKWFSSVMGWVNILWMKWNVSDPRLRKGLTPDYKYGTRLPQLSDTFYQAMTKKNVLLVKEAIRKVDGNKIVTEDGNQRKLDVLILCTGYKLQDYFAPMKVTGRAGQDLLNLWKQSTPRTYYGTTCSAAPNLFILLGPNTGLFCGFVISMECQMNIVINVIKHMMKIGAAVFNVTEEAEEDCVREVSERLKSTPWYGAAGRTTWCSFNEHGDQTLLWPGTSTSFWWKTRKFDAKKFEFQNNFELMEV